ncbi:MAG: hypothetical protein R2761_17645 [Acidimicrobiales bacterium]
MSALTDQVDDLVSSAEDIVSSVVDRSAGAASALVDRHDRSGRRRAPFLLLALLAVAACLAFVARKRRSASMPDSVSTPAGMSDELVEEAAERSET